MPEAYLIEIKLLKLYAYHGIHPEEKSLGQEFEIDLTVTLPIAEDSKIPCKADYLSYVTLIEKVKESFTSQKYDLIEEAALDILECLSLIPIIKKVQVTIRKLHPPISESLGSVGVTFERDY